MRSINRALVTGGCGFIGSHLVDELLKKGIETFVIDDLSSGNTENLSDWTNNPLLHIVIGDISDIHFVLKDVKDIDIVFHEAAMSGVTKSINHPKVVFDVNVSSTIELLNYCLSTKIKRIVFASSAGVYGDVDKTILKEDLFCKPISPYGASKLAVENFLYSYWKSYGLEFVALRYFNVYGPKQQNNEYSGVIPIFIDRLLNNLKPTIFGNGHQMRDFVNVKDIVNANILSMDSSNAHGQTYNIGTGKGTTIVELLDILSNIMGKGNIDNIFVKERIGDINKSVSYIVKSKNMLNYYPKVNLVDGLEFFVNWYIKRKK